MAIMRDPRISKSKISAAMTLRLLFFSPLLVFLSSVCDWVMCLFHRVFINLPCKLLLPLLSLTPIYHTSSALLPSNPNRTFKPPISNNLAPLSPTYSKQAYSTDRTLYHILPLPPIPAPPPFFSIPPHALHLHMPSIHHLLLHRGDSIDILEKGV